MLLTIVPAKPVQMFKSSGGQGRTAVASVDAVKIK
jgi:hypothetical protein